MTVYWLLPLVGGAAVHGACMKYGWLGFLVKPIDGGRDFRGRPLFGHSKTWRGPVAVAAGAAATWGLQCQLLHALDPASPPELAGDAPLPGLWVMALAGAAAELAELPNSFVKRRLGIEPSGTTSGLPGVVFLLWDQLDLLLGYWLVLVFWLPVTPLRLVVSILVVGGVHPLLTLAGYLLGMRPTAR